MASSVVGLFDTQAQAQEAVRQLIASGVDSKNISVVASEGGSIRRETVDESGDLASAGMVSGAASGLLVGGLIGLLVGATVLAVPPVGFVVAGPIAGLITGAGVGMVSGGLLGGLIGLGIPEEEAHIYAESVRRGGILVTANVLEADRIRVQQILAMAGAVNIQDRAAIYRQSGFTAYDPSLPVYTPEEIAAERARYGVVTTGTAAIPAATVAPGTTVIEETAVATPIEANASDTFYRTDYQARYAGFGTFETFRPAYQFGTELAHRPEFRGLDWTTAEPQAQRLWESVNPGTWITYAGAIRSAWDRELSLIGANRASVM